MRRWGVTGLAVVGLAACGGSDPVGLELEITPDVCEASRCTVSTSGAALLVRGDGDVLTLYGELALPDAVTAVVEVAFKGSKARARYREVRSGAVRFRGAVSELEASPPGHDGVSPVAGHFSFLAEDGGQVRRVRGVILPATEEAIRVEGETTTYVHSPAYVSCEGDVYVPPPTIDETTPLPDDPWVPEPRPDDDDGWVDVDDLSDDQRDTAAPADSGCDGDSYDGYDDGYGDDWDDDGDTYDAPADSGCDGDSYDDEYSDMDSSSDSGCEGDSYEGGYEMSAVLPVMGSLWRLGWPLGLAGLFNRRKRRRSARSPRAPR